MTKLVGIVNVTPDSFSDGGLFYDPASAIARADQLFHEGAYLIDIGAESTRPGATALSPEEEWQRLEPVLQVLLTKYPGRVSLDSYHPESIEKAFRIHPVIVNDVTGMNNPRMVQTVVRLQATVIVSHLPGLSIQQAHEYKPITDVKEVTHDLLAKEAILIAAGLHADQIILDPGIGFGKSPEVNWQLLRFAELVPGHRVMIGYSRKRFLGPDRMELEPNLKAGHIACAAGAAYLRVHDVAGHMQLMQE